MNFIERVLKILEETPHKPLVTEVEGESLFPTVGTELARMTAQIRAALRAWGVGPGDRVVLIAPNSARWVACDIAILAEGAISVPLYARQDPAELAEMIRDCAPKLVICATDVLKAAVSDADPDGPGAKDAEGGAVITTFAAAFEHDDKDGQGPAAPRGVDEPVSLIYTSGTSGKAKGVILSLGNMDYMLPAIQSAVDSMMANHTPATEAKAASATSAGAPPAISEADPRYAAGFFGFKPKDDRVFHYLPFCFAGSRMVLWMCLYRANGIMISTDLNNLAVEFRTAAPNYFLNVPALLERIKAGVEAKLRDKPKSIQAIYARGMTAYKKRRAGEAGLLDYATLKIAERLIFDRVRKQIGVNLRCLICGSAPLSPDTQMWFEMLGIPVYQVYGLTETTAIVTMDQPGGVLAGRVGQAIMGCEMMLGDEDELLVRGPNIFKGYWENTEATAEAFTEGGWFRTGDQATLVDNRGQSSLAIVGRLKSLLVPESGHNVAPEPIEQAILGALSGGGRHSDGGGGGGSGDVGQVVVIGHGRPFLTAIVTGTASREAVQAAIDVVNGELPHYRRVRGFFLSPEVMTPESGLLTANRKLRRKVITAHFADEIDELYP